jgi:hypothetical protein
MGTSSGMKETKAARMPTPPTIMPKPPVKVL